MPAQYLSMKDKFIRDGMPEEEAEAKAAAIYNSKHKSNPVTRKRHEAVSKGHDIGTKIAENIEQIFRESK